MDGWVGLGMGSLCGIFVWAPLCGANKHSYPSYPLLKLWWWCLWKSLKLCNGSKEGQSGLSTLCQEREILLDKYLTQSGVGHLPTCESGSLLDTTVDTQLSFQAPTAAEQHRWKHNVAPFELHQALPPPDLPLFLHSRETSSLTSVASFVPWFHFLAP